MAIRVLSVEIKQIDGSKEADAAARTRLKELCEMVQQATNYAWAEWFSWHHLNGSLELIRKFQADWIAYKQAEETKGKSERPKLELKSISSELSIKMYHGVAERWPELHTKVVTLMLNKLSSLMSGGKKSAKGAFPGWHSVILFRESIPSSIHPLPLPFESPKAGAKSKNGNAKLMLPESNKESHRLILSLAREEVPGKKIKPSVKFDCAIWDLGRNMVSRRVTLSKIASGEYQLKGSQLCFKRGKLFAQLAYEIPDATKIDLKGTAIVSPGRKHPVLFKLPEKSGSHWLCGDGRVVGEVRRRLMNQRLSRKWSYRQNPTSNSKGHGRDRGIEKVTKLSRRWRDFVSTLNKNIAAALVKQCLRHEVGVVILGRPKKDSRFLSNVGNDSRYDVTSWDWYGLEKRIQDKCNEFGITVIVRPEKTEGGSKARSNKKRG